MTNTDQRTGVVTNTNQRTDVTNTDQRTDVTNTNQTTEVVTNTNHRTDVTNTEYRCYKYHLLYPVFKFAYNGVYAHGNIKKII